MIAIVDYGLGNILAFVNVFKRLNIPVTIGKTAADLEKASKLILPGVGSFDHAMELLDQSGLRNKLDEMVLERRMPVLGICVGMQILAHSSEEGVRPGLGWLSGRVKRFDPGKVLSPMRVPHMGWNDVTPRKGTILFNDLEQNARFYFLHSYYFDCTSANDVLAKAKYGCSFAAAVGSRNIYGVQFHPEKSHHYGSQLLKNFTEL